MSTTRTWTTRSRTSLQGKGRLFFSVESMRQTYPRARWSSLSAGGRRPTSRPSPHPAKARLAASPGRARYEGPGRQKVGPNARIGRSVRCRRSLSAKASRPVAGHLPGMCRGSVVRSQLPARFHCRIALHRITGPRERGAVCRPGKGPPGRPPAAGRNAGPSRRTPRCLGDQRLQATARACLRRGLRLTGWMEGRTLAAEGRRGFVMDWRALCVPTTRTHRPRVLRQTVWWSA